MKNSKRIAKILKHLQEMEEFLDYYSNGRAKDFPVVKELHSLVHDFGIDEKEHNVRLIQKWEKKHGG